MKKFIMALAGFAMLGASVVGILNKGELGELRAEAKAVKDKVTELNSKLAEAEEKKSAAEEKETQAKDTRNQASASVAEAEQKMKNVGRALEEVTAELKKVEIEKKEIDLLIRQAFPDGVITSAEDLQMSVTMLKDQLTEKQNKKTELNNLLSGAAAAKQVQVAKVKEEENFQMKRAQRLAVNSLVATVIAVNKEWDFVMVNAGRAHGVGAEDSLLVKRGNSRVGRLRIVNVEDNVTIADIVDDSLVSGIDVQPGDKVVFENVQ